MANCCICSSKIAPNVMSRPLSETSSGLELCFTCYNMKLKLSSPNKMEQLTSISYFKDKMNEGLYDPNSTKALQAVLNRFDPEKIEEEKRNAIKEYNERVQNFIFTTTDKFEGHKIQRYLGFVSGDIPFETDTISEADPPSVRKNSYSSKLMEAREDALKRLKLKCVKKGANAAVGVHIDTIIPAPNIIIVIAEGTAVIIEKEK